MTVSSKGKQGTGSSRRGDTRVSTILDVRGVGKKTAKASQKRKQTVKKTATPKTVRPSKEKKDGTRVSTILDVRAAGKKPASSRRRNTTRDGK